MQINNKEALQRAIDAVYSSRADFVRELRKVFPWRFTSTANGESWISKKCNGHEGLTQTDRMFFELWFKHKKKKK